jgi:cobalamin biosynthesis Mg chelatase CobN
MKFRITLKSPDAVDYAVEEAARETLEEAGRKVLEGETEDEDEGEVDQEDEELDEYEEDDYESVLSDFTNLFRSATKKWFKWGECITVEIDTDEETCVVIPAKEC